jgi:hypothetical protein
LLFLIKESDDPIKVTTINLPMIQAADSNSPTVEDSKTEASADSNLEGMIIYRSPHSLFHLKMDSQTILNQRRPCITQPTGVWLPLSVHLVFQSVGPFPRRSQRYIYSSNRHVCLSRPNNPRNSAQGFALNKFRVS